MPMDVRLQHKQEERLRVGTVLWKRKISEGVFNPLAVVDRYLILESEGYLYAFNAINGTMADEAEYGLRMKGVNAHYFSFSGLSSSEIAAVADTPPEIRPPMTSRIWDVSSKQQIYTKNGDIVGAPLTMGKKAFFGFINEWGRSYMIAFDLAGRRVLWERELDGHRIILKFPPVTDGENIYCRTLSHLVAISADDGRSTWVTKLTGKEKEEGYRDTIYFSAPLIHDRNVYLLRDEYLIPYRTNNGQTHYNSWRRYLGSIGPNAVEAASVPIVSRGRMYTAGGLYFLNGSMQAACGDTGGYSRIAAVDLSEKRTLWETDIDRVNVRKIVIAGKFLIIADHQGRVLCLSSATGRSLWGAELEGGVQVNPVVWFGRAFFGTDQGWLYCMAL
ncbi:MAG: PQQ-binding-like beta-propeller repeat protein [Deltaproteobacteria bacterium]|nr:PQQ-binding-like beta-propeller repeat protein [Candidatus Zymogenaceae bacterium]